MTKITKQELNQMIKEEVRRQTSRNRRRLFESKASLNTFMDVVKYNGFTHKAMKALYDYLNEDTPDLLDEPINLHNFDSFKYYSDPVEAANDQGGDFDDEDYDEAFQWLVENFQIVIREDENREEGGVIVDESSDY